jgi:hypothetical protein
VRIPRDAITYEHPYKLKVSEPVVRAYAGGIISAALDGENALMIGAILNKVKLNFGRKAYWDQGNNIIFSSTISVSGNRVPFCLGLNLNEVHRSICPELIQSNNWFVL